MCAVACFGHARRDDPRGVDTLKRDTPAGLTANEVCAGNSIEKNHGKERHDGCYTCQTLSVAVVIAVDDDCVHRAENMERATIDPALMPLLGVDRLVCSQTGDLTIGEDSWSVAFGGCFGGAFSAKSGTTVSHTRQAMH